MAATLMERFQLIKGIDPVANAFASTVYSDVVDMSDFSRLLFVRYDGVGTTGTSTVTVNACDNTTPSNRTPIPFRYRQILTGDTEGTLTAAAVTGFTTTAGSSKIVAIEVDELDVASTGYRYVECKFVEVAASAVLGGVLIFGEKKVRRAIAASSID